MNYAYLKDYLMKKFKSKKLDLMTWI